MHAEARWLDAPRSESPLNANRELLRAGKLNYVGKVRNGFVPHMRCAMMPLLQQVLTDECPFTDLPEKRRTWYSLTRDEMQKCQWLKPLIVVQIQFQEWTLDGHLRHARFVGLRNEKDPQRIVRE